MFANPVLAKAMRFQFEDVGPNGVVDELWKTPAFGEMVTKTGKSKDRSHCTLLPEKNLFSFESRLLL